MTEESALGLFSLKMAYRQVRARRRQMALSVAAVALGVALVVAIGTMNDAVLHSFLDTADAMGGRAALTVSAGTGLFFPEETTALVESVAGVALAVPVVRAVAFPDDGSGELLTVHGVDLARDEAVRVYHTAGGEGVVGGDLVEFLNRPDSIILGREWAEARGLAVDDTLRLVTPHGVQTFIIRGLLDAQGLARTLAGRLVVMDLFAAERAFAGDGQVSQIDVLLAPDHAPGKVRHALLERLPAGLVVEEPALRRDVIRHTVGGFQRMIAAFGLLAVVAGFVICYSRMNAVFEARAWQVGLLRAVGLHRSAVFGELLLEGLLLGLLGTALGILLGSAIARFGLPALAATTALAFRMPVPAVQAAGLPSAALLQGLLVGLTAAVAAVAMPALRLARRQPIAALRLRGRELPPLPRNRRWMVRAVVIAVLAAALLLGQILSGAVALGHANTALIAIAALVLATPLVSLGGRALGSLWSRLFGPTGRFAARHVEWQPRRSALTVATLGAGLGAVLLFGILAWSFECTVVQQLGGRMRADLVATSAFVSGGYLTAPVTEDVLAEIGRVPGVDLSFGEQYRDSEYAGAPLVVNAFDAACFHDRRACNWPIDDSTGQAVLEEVAAGRGVMLSATFAHQHAIAPGQEIELATPTGPLRMRALAVTSGQPASAVVLSRAVYRRAWNDRQITYAHAVLADPRETETVAAALRRAVGERHRLTVYRRDEIVEYFARQVRQAFALSYLMEAITFLLVAVAMGDTLAASVGERLRRYATMRALGYARADVFRLVLLEGTTIALLGLALAAFVGLALGVFWVEVQFPAILGWRLDLGLPWRFFLASGLLALALCFAGAVLPSRRAARVAVAAALRND